nr:putative serine/threonine-protein kinase isoform X1 [Tanacetum cinerariifolium]
MLDCDRVTMRLGVVELWRIDGSWAGGCSGLGGAYGLLDDLFTTCVKVVVVVAFLFSPSTSSFKAMRSFQGYANSFIDSPCSSLDNIRKFSYKELRIATYNFDRSTKIGRGGFGVVYKGILKDGTQVAVKALCAESKQGVREFLTEINTISNVRHRNLVELIGCCLEKARQRSSTGNKGPRFALKTGQNCFGVLVLETISGRSSSTQAGVQRRKFCWNGHGSSTKRGDC